MKSQSRTINSIRNIIASVSYQIVLLLLSFVSRTIFIRNLGPEYLGINGLYSNLLSVLSLAELGVGSAIIYSLYKPLAENDTLKISALMNFYKEVYRYIAIFIAGVGIALVPFLDLFIKTDNPIHNMELYYLLFLADIVIGYLFIYKSSIINADQKMYLIKIYSFLFQVFKIIIQVFIIYTTKSYTLYLVIQILFTLLNNFYIAYKSDHLYPQIKNNTSRLAPKERKNIFENIKSMFVYRIGGVLLNNTDNILISGMIGVIWVGLYSNYVLIVGSIQTIVEILFSSINASIGNLNADVNNKNKESIYNVLTFIAFWIYGVCSLCLLNLLDDFIGLWIGGEYVLNQTIPLAITLNFYIPGILKSTALYRDTTGLFRKTKFIFLTTAALNIILSIILGRIYGLSGILFATAISRILTNFWWEPKVLYNEYFKKSSKLYFINQLYYMGILIITNILINALQYPLSLGTNNIATFIVKAMICFILPNVIFYLTFRKTDEFKYLSDKLLNLTRTV
nr:transporter [uncultured Trichococcus sp.]